MLNLPSSSPELPCESLYFLHIPKTAGTSLRYWLDDWFATGDRLECDVLEEVYRVDVEAINRHRFFSGHFGYKIFEYLNQPIPTVTWLREPLAREISHYHFILSRYDQLAEIAKRNQQPDWITYYDLVRNHSLAEICQANYFIGFSDNLQTRYLSGSYPSPAEVQVDRAMLDQAKDNLAKLWFVGICEWMSPSIDLLTYQMACPRRRLSMHSNQSSTQGSEKQSFLSSSERKAILDVNRYDVELYEFARNLLRERLTTFWKSSPELARLATTADEILERYPNPDVDLAIKQVIDTHFQHRRRSIPQVTSIDVDFAQANFLGGWYPRAIGKSNKIIRWAGPTHSSSVHVPLEPHHTYRFSCDAHYVARHPILENLKLRVGGQCLPTSWKKVGDPQGGHIFKITCVIPSDLLSDQNAFTEIVVETCESVEIEIPNEPARRVSLATSGFQLVAA